MPLVALHRLSRTNLQDPSQVSHRYGVGDMRRLRHVMSDVQNDNAMLIPQLEVRFRGSHPARWGKRARSTGRAW
jgi:hypothetical protein